MARGSDKVSVDEMAVGGVVTWKRHHGLCCFQCARWQVTDLQRAQCLSSFVEAHDAQAGPTVMAKCRRDREFVEGKCNGTEETCHPRRRKRRRLVRSELYACCSFKIAYFALHV